jgi:flagellar motor protein MotB
VSVSGYGDMRPLDVANPTADVNRRVEISLQEVN